MNKKKIYINFCIDTEGPLYESLDASFERLHELLGLDIARTEENFHLIKNRKIDLNGLENAAAEIISDHLNNYNTTWGEIDGMLSNVLDVSFRKKFKDSNNNSLILNWFIMDHVGYENNPRRRDIGYHNIFDHYRRILDNVDSCKDGIYWHFHPMSFYKDAHKCATSYTHSPHLYEGLSRKIIERHWFPNAYRAGFQTERQDCNLFLEQWIPFDLSNMSKEEEFLTADMEDGRLNDWRWAPNDWSIYHPHHDNYQLKGNMRRYIGRCLNILNRAGNIDIDEIENAFIRANDGIPTMISVAGHDWRDISVEIELLYEIIYSVSKRYPDVEYINSKVSDSFRSCSPDMVRKNPIKLKVKLKKVNNKRWRLHVDTISGQVFGPQPFLAIETKSKKFVQDNLDVGKDFNSWTYTFDDESIKTEDLKRIGIACNDAQGSTFIKVLDATEIPHD
jgi:hypothetical protein